MIIFILIILILALAAAIICYGFFYMATVRYRNENIKTPKAFLPHMEKMNAGMQWFDEQEKELIRIPAHDSVPLAAHFIPAADARGTLILMHGYRASGRRDFSCVLEKYHSLGYNLLVVCQRAHGLSGGRFISFGVIERFDCLSWAKYISDRFGSDHCIFLDGISMGASTVLMAAGLELPENVKGIIADCGFTSPYAQLEHVAKSKYHIPARPVLEGIDILCKNMAGFGLREYSTVEAMKTNTKPILFIHGETDHFVPCKFTLETYEACTAEKELLIIPEAGHGMSYLLDKEKCDRALEDFLWKYS